MKQNISAIINLQCTFLICIVDACKPKSMYMHMYMYINWIKSGNHNIICVQFLYNIVYVYRNEYLEHDVDLR